MSGILYLWSALILQWSCVMWSEGQFQDPLDDTGAKPDGREMRLRRIAHLWLLLLAVLPSTAWANAGTPLMWASMLHLSFGNALIGLGEGLLLVQFCRVRLLPAIVVMIIANYVSAWVGFYGLSLLHPYLSGMTIANIGWWLAALVLITFIITCALECIFVYVATRRQSPSLVKVLTLTVLVNVCSYCALLVWYGVASQTSMITQLTNVEAKELIPTQPYELFYLRPDGSEVIRATLGSPQVTGIYQVPQAQRAGNLMISFTSGPSCDLVMTLTQPQSLSDGESLPVIRKDFSAQIPTWKGPSDYHRLVWGGSGPALSYQESSPWKIRTDFWAAQGISGINEQTRERYRFALEMPMAWWQCRNVTELADDLLVFQLGADQICLLHPPTRRIALLARGHSPIIGVPGLPASPFE